MWQFENLMIEKVIVVLGEVIIPTLHSSLLTTHYLTKNNTKYLAGK